MQCVCVFQLFEVASANEWKSIDITGLFPESDGASVSVRCSTWSADGKRIIGAAKNAVFVSDRSIFRSSRVKLSRLDADNVTAGGARF